MMRLFFILLPLSILQLCFLRTIEGFLTPSPFKGGSGRFLLSTTRPPQHQQLQLPTFNNHHHSNNNRCRSSSSSLYSTVSSYNYNNQDLMPGIAAIDARNNDILEKLEQLRTSPYFRFFSVDILASCEYIPQELVECYTESCEIYPADEEKIPDNIRAVDQQEHEFELDGWGRWDMPSEDYYDTQEFPEGYTGYNGAEVWNFIHNRICFAGYNYNDDHWKADYNKAVSGLHSMISAQIVRGIRDKVQNGDAFGPDEIWTDPRAEFERRLGPRGETPLAIENLYFFYMLLLTAAKTARDRLLTDCNAGRIDQEAADVLRSFFNSPLLDEPAIQVASRKLHDHAVKDSDSIMALWEARMRTRELTRIMNCAQCNKCRLHGKIATMGLSTAMHILVGREGQGEDPNSKRIHRVELATLMTTLHKCSRAVQFCQEMQQ